MKILAQLVIGVGKKMMKEKTPLLDESVCFQIGIKYFELEVFYYFSEKLTLSQKLRYFRGSRFQQQLSNASYQVSF